MSLKLLEQIAVAFNRLTGNYQARVKDGLIDTGDNLVKTIRSKKLKTSKKQNHIDHYCRQWTANRKKLR